MMTTDELIEKGVCSICGGMVVVRVSHRFERMWCASCGAKEVLPVFQMVTEEDEDLAKSRTGADNAR
jgi:hypothetical protein